MLRASLEDDKMPSKRSYPASRVHLAPDSRLLQPVVARLLILSGAQGIDTFSTPPKISVSPTPIAASRPAVSRC